jgi:hypothetical protein
MIRLIARTLAALLVSLGCHAAANYSDLWWNAAESGWGLVIVDRGDHAAALWLTYREDGSAVWYSVPHGIWSEDHRFVEGDVYESRGPGFAESPYDRAAVQRMEVGSARIDFAPPGAPEGVARFAYTLGPVSGAKDITRQPYGNAPAQWGSDLTEIYANTDEGGWGYALVQHGPPGSDARGGGQVFAILFVYGADGQPTFMVMPGVRFEGADRFTGSVYATRGPWLGAPFDRAAVKVSRVGDATVAFESGGGPRRGTIDAFIAGTRFVKAIEPDRLAPVLTAAAPTGQACNGTYSLTIRHKACTNGIPFSGDIKIDPLSPRGSFWTKVFFGGRITRNYVVENGVCVAASTTNNTSGSVFPEDGSPTQLQMFVYADGSQFLALLSTVKWSISPRGNDVAVGTLTRDIDPGNALFLIDGQYRCVVCYTGRCPPD